jgi:hypothetical protein
MGVSAITAPCRFQIHPVPSTWKYRALCQKTVGEKRRFRQTGNPGRIVVVIYYCIPEIMADKACKFLTCSSLYRAPITSISAVRRGFGTFYAAFWVTSGIRHRPETMKKQH